MGDERLVFEDAKTEALAAFAAIAAFIDISGEQETSENGRTADSLRAAAVRHLSAALEIMGRGERR